MDKRMIKTPWWSWLALLGLKAPIAAVVWAYAYSRLFYLVRDAFWTYQFLFVAVWCVVMGSRLIAVVNRDRDIRHDPRLYFARSNFVWLSLLVLIAVICGLWIIFFQVGSGMISYATLPLAMSISYLLIRLRSGRDGSGQIRIAIGSFCAAVAFAFGVSIPAYFYGIPGAGLGFFFYTPTWYLAVFTYLVMMSRRRWMLRGVDLEREEQSAVGLSFGMFALLIFCLFSAWQTSRFAETWFFYSLGFGCACLYLLERFFSRKLDAERLCPLAWLVMIMPAILLCILLSSAG